ncbi:DUF2165 domain-containing protein [Vibrio sp.]|nr:DUF2165 domain-containing protein [Vibrio sp.]
MQLEQAHRISKIILALSVGIFCILVGYNNIIDYETNFTFVKHVLAMDDMQPWFDGQAVGGRAIENPTLHHIGYSFIIAGELAAGFLCLAGTAFMIKGFKSTQFESGQAFYLLGCSIAVLVWYLGFAVIGAEYFSMWASKWNGQMKAYTFVTFIVISMIYIIIDTPKSHSK